MLYFPVAVLEEKEGDYGVVVPDLPGCFSVGDDLTEAITNAQEAIECHVEGMMMDDEQVPSAQSIELHRDNPDYDGAIWTLIPLDLNKISGKSKRVNVTFSESVLSKIDAFAAKKGESRAGFLQNAALDYMSRELSRSA